MEAIDDNESGEVVESRGNHFQNRLQIRREKHL